jgi:YVTN family beta-propeller protein
VPVRSRILNAAAALAVAAFVCACTPQSTRRGTAPPSSAAPSSTQSSTAGVRTNAPAAGVRTNAPAAKPNFLPAVARDLPRVYVPNRASGYVSVIDPRTLRVIGRIRTGLSPQHVVPSWNLRTLWVTSNGAGKTDGSLTAIDPRTAKPGRTIAVDDPYNMYFTPDGSSAIVVAEARARLDFRDPRTMRLKGSLPVPLCAGINHGDYARSYRYAIFTCEFNGWLAKVDPVHRKVLGYLKLSKGGMPQDVRVGPGGDTFFVADMHADGVFIVDGLHFKEVGFVPTGVGAHGLYPSRDGTKLYVSNRGTHALRGTPHSKYGSVSVIDFATRRVLARWPIPGGGSPDMGNVSADGRTLWLAGRFDASVYAIDTRTGKVRTIRVGTEPHGLAVWPQPGRYSLGHTGIMRP